MSIFKRPICLLLIVATANLSLPWQPARAAMVTTEAVIGETVAGDVDRNRIRIFLRREDVQVQLEAYGVEPEEALARIDGLTDQEVAEIAAKLDELPAGGEIENIFEEMATIFVIGLVLLAILSIIRIVQLIVD